MDSAVTDPTLATHLSLVATLVLSGLMLKKSSLCLYSVFFMCVYDCQCKQQLLPFFLKETHTQFSLRYDVSLSILCTLSLVFSRRPLTSKARVVSEVSPCEVFDGQRGTGTGFSPSTSIFFLSVLFQQCYALFFNATSVLWLLQLAILTFVTKVTKWFRVCCGYAKPL